MLHVTLDAFAESTTVKCTSDCDSHGSWKVRFKSTPLSVTAATSCLPLPTSSFPSHASHEPTSPSVPPNSCFIFGSRFAQGDHSFMVFKLFMCAITTGGGALTTVERATVYSFGRISPKSNTIATRHIMPMK